MTSALHLVTINYEFQSIHFLDENSRENYLISILSLFTDFQLKFYRVRIFYLCRNCKQNNWWRHNVGHAWSI